MKPDQEKAAADAAAFFLQTAPTAVAPYTAAPVASRYQARLSVYHRQGMFDMQIAHHG